MNRFVTGPGIIVLAASLLTACGSSSSKGTERAPPSAKAAPSPSTSAASTTAPVAAGLTSADVDSPCGGQGVIVTFSPESFMGVNSNDAPAALTRLRTLAGRTILPMRELVTRTDYSPAIRTVRLALRDSAAVPRAVADLAKSPDVSEVALDACALTIQKKASAPAR